MPGEEMTKLTQFVIGFGGMLLILMSVSAFQKGNEMTTTTKDLANTIEGAFSCDDIAAFGDGGVEYTIGSAGRRKVGGQDGEDKTCVGFVEVAKYVVLNKTRSSQLIALFGADADPIGKKVRLYVDVVKVNNMSHRMICFGAP